MPKALTTLGQTTSSLILTMHALLTKGSNVSERLLNSGIQQKRVTLIIIQNRYFGNIQFFYNLLAFLSVFAVYNSFSSYFDLFFTHRFIQKSVALSLLVSFMFVKAKDS